MLSSDKSTPVVDANSSNGTEPRAPKTVRNMHVDMTPSVQKTIEFNTPITKASKKNRKTKKKVKGYKSWLRSALKSKKSNAEKKAEQQERVLSQGIAKRKVDLI